MAKLWCWLFGHKIMPVPAHFLTNTDVSFLMYCEHCGKTMMNAQRKNGPAG